MTSNVQVLSPRGSLATDTNRSLEECLRESTAKEFTEMKKRRGANMLRTEQEERGVISEDDNVYCICRRGEKSEGERGEVRGMRRGERDEARGVRRERCEVRRCESKGGFIHFFQGGVEMSCSGP